MKLPLENWDTCEELNLDPEANVEVLFVWFLWSGGNEICELLIYDDLKSDWLLSINLAGYFMNLSIEWKNFSKSNWERTDDFI